MTKIDIKNYTDILKLKSNIEKEKGEASDAFKRAAVQFGIARDLYSSETYKVELNQYNGKWYPPKNWKPPTKGE